MKQVPARTGSTDDAGFQDRSVSRRRCAIRSVTFFGEPPTQAHRLQPAPLAIPLLRRWVARGARLCQASVSDRCHLPRAGASSLGNEGNGLAISGRGGGGGGDQCKSFLGSTGQNVGVLLWWTWWVAEIGNFPNAPREISATSPFPIPLSTTSTIDANDGVVGRSPSL